MSYLFCQVHAMLIMYASRWNAFIYAMSATYSKLHIFLPLEMVGLARYSNSRELRCCMYYSCYSNKYSKLNDPRVRHKDRKERSS